MLLRLRDIIVRGGVREVREEGGLSMGKEDGRTAERRNGSEVGNSGGRPAAAWERWRMKEEEVTGGPEHQG